VGRRLPARLLVVAVPGVLALPAAPGSYAALGGRRGMHARGAPAAAERYRPGRRLWSRGRDVAGRVDRW